MTAGINPKRSVALLERRLAETTNERHRAILSAIAAQVAEIVRQANIKVE